MKPGEQVDLHWLCQGNAKVRLEPGGLELDGQSSIAVVPDRTTVYTLSVSNLLGGTSRSVEVRVEAPRRVLTEKDLEDPAEAVKPLDRMDLAEAFHRGEAMRDAAPEGSWTLRLVVSGRANGLKQVARAQGHGDPSAALPAEGRLPFLASLLRHLSQSSPRHESLEQGPRITAHDLPGHAAPAPTLAFSTRS